MAKYEIGDKYPNVVRDGTQLIVKVADGGVGDAPAGALVSAPNDAGAVNKITDSQIDNAKGILLAKNEDGTLTVLLRGIFKGEVFYYDSTSNTYVNIQNHSLGYPFVAGCVIAIGP